MEVIVKQRLNGKNPEEIKDLHIEGSKFGSVEGLNKDFTCLEELEILNCGLKSLKGLPTLPSVRTLLLGDNFLKGKEEIETIVESCKGLKTLSLVGNRFESPNDFQPLTSLESFASLDVFDCPLTNQKDYRDKLWALLPKLVVLDGYDKDGREVNEDDEEEEEEEEGSSDDDDVGLDYLQKDFSDSEDEGEEYNPEGGASPPSDDHNIEDDEEDDDDDETAAGPSHKKPKLDPPLEDEA